MTQTIACFVQQAQDQLWDRFCTLPRSQYGNFLGAAPSGRVLELGDGVRRRITETSIVRWQHALAREHTTGDDGQ